MSFDPTTAIVFGVVGMIMGAYAGRGPQAAARELGREGFGLFAMIVCMATGFLCGLLSFPVGWVLTAVVKGMGPVPHLAGGGYNAGPREADFGRAFRNAPAGPTDAPYTVIGPVIVCNKCRHSGPRKPDGNPPVECPSCKQRFTSGAKQTAAGTRRSRRAEVVRDDEDLVELRLARPDRR